MKGKIVHDFLRGKTNRMPHTVSIKVNPQKICCWCVFAVFLQKKILLSSLHASTPIIVSDKSTKTLSNLMVILGDLQFGRTDMGVANLFLRFPEAEYVGFTYPYSFDRYCFLVRLLYVYFFRKQFILLYF